MVAGPSAVLLTFARRGEDDAMVAAVGLLRQIAPSVVAIGTPVSARVMERLDLAQITILGKGAPLRGVLREVRRRRPRAAAVVYSGPGLDGHLKLEGLALLTGAPRILRVRPTHPVQSVDRLRLGLIVWAKLVQAAGCLVAGAATCGVAWGWLRLAQRFAGGDRAGRA